ncbi:MAG TPA: chromosome segregation protein SMC [Bacillota bacterium]|nr:chromosome segregation protein SMC [Bacillota bacterium]
MYLKRLEILGFKSFADKIKLEFLPGVTAVVGPNGSGKSNISDALRWVLGEQSIKNLRGAKMDDVIFAGSELRKPLGLAEVTMVLDNTDHSVPLDFAEISVTRRLFRSGVSEYLINKSPVRLKDIQELFFDTGLGKDAYSVIGQGKIDSILSVKAEERRSIFEEAAGIIKYKSRKQVAERKLEETDSSLLRIKDIINELTLQLGPLENQSRLATRFLELKEQLTGLEINHLGRKILKLQTGLEELSASKIDLEEKFRDFESQTNVIDSEIEENRLQLMNQDDQINQLHEEFYRIQNAIDKYSEQVNFLTAKLTDLEKQEQDLEKGLNSNLQRKETMLQEQTVIESEIVQVKASLEESRELLAAEEAGLQQQSAELKQAETSEQTFKDTLFEVLNEVAALKNKANSAALQKDFIQKQVSDCRKKFDSLQVQRLELEEKHQEKQAGLQVVNTEIVDGRKYQTELSHKVIGLEEEIASIDTKNLEWQQKIRGLEGKLSVLAEMEKSHQGYFQGVKALVDEAAGQPFHKAIHGIVADLMKVKSGMELAIETALGSALQNVVIENDRATQEAIAYLKRHGKGRATFLPLNQVRGSEPRLLQYQSILTQCKAQPALALLEFNPQYQQIFNYMLNQIIVAPDLKAAVQLGTKLDRSFRIVTPEGDLVSPGGAITGGSIDRRRAGLLTRRREIDDLKTEKHEAEAFLEKGVHTAKTKRDEHKECLRRIEEYKRTEQEANLRRVALEREAQALQQGIHKCREEQQLLEEQLTELGEETAKFAAGNVELTQVIEAREAYLKTVEQQIGELTGNIDSVRQLREASVQRISELKSKLSAGEQELHGKLVLKENFLKQSGEVDIYCDEFRNKKDELQADRAKISLTITDLHQKIDEEKTHLDGQQELINTKKADKEKLFSYIKELETRQRNYRRKSTEYQNQLHRMELLINDRTGEIEHLQTNLVEYYGEDWQTSLNTNWEQPENAAEQINRLKNQLKDLGQVNLAAIEDYQQLTERYEFLTAQSDDLAKARESLTKVIAEIERTIETRFTETFEQVKLEFKKLFSELFEGGHADLFLLDPEDVLNSGIEIVAQPPGKKLQSLSLLSGGERAMTAIALLFSILSIKPAPFCVLDEIDAALDDANVQRFSHLLEIFSEQSQFVVVTHRRGTMEVANALYGVTMEEMGISKLISLDLNQEKAG